MGKLCQGSEAPVLRTCSAPALGENGSPSTPEHRCVLTCRRLHRQATTNVAYIVKAFSCELSSVKSKDQAWNDDASPQEIPEQIEFTFSEHTIQGNNEPDMKCAQ